MTIAEKKENLPRPTECILFGCLGLREDQADGSILWRCVRCHEIVDRMSSEKHNEIKQRGAKEMGSIWSVKIGPPHYLG
jgi:hypothetical protein